jgi:hypothetical protein
VYDFDQTFAVHEVDETAQVTDMMGDASQKNIANGLRPSPSRSLVYLWFFVLAVYWFLGYFFKGSR